LQTLFDIKEIPESTQLRKMIEGVKGKFFEPFFGHMKNEHRLARNYLLGKTGDKINAILSGCAFNLKKIINFLEMEKLCFD